jgi:iron complex outermembrane receptor protein
MLKRTTLAKSLLIAFSGSAALYSTAVVAQQTAQELQRVTVTGSNIKRTDTETASPVQTITREDIQKSGKTTIAEVILGLNGNSNGSVPISFGVGFAAGASGVSLRGLGANSTLVLLNGRRMAPYGLADDGQRTFVDLSTIPLDAVERVDIVKDGASAIYGSDAIAGVVNIITRQDFKGIILNASYGQTRYGDGKNPKASITGGFGDLSKDKYNIFFTLEAQKIGEIRQSDRASRNGIGDPDIMSHGYDLGTGNGYGGYQVSATTVSSSLIGYARPYTTANGATAVAGSAYTALAPCTTAPAISALGYTGCTYNSIDFLQLQPKEDKLNFLTRGTLEISPSLTAFAEVGLFSSKVSTTYTPSAVSGSWADPVGGTVKNNVAITMGPNHPDNPFNAASGANGGAGYNARLRYLTGDLGGRNNTYDTTVTRLLGGLKGTAWNWDWEAGLLYTESKTDQTTDGYIRDSTLRDYLNGTNLTGLNPSLTYYRLGVNAGLNSAATREAIAPHITNSAKTSITALDVKASRELMQLSGGPLAVAVGAEFRQEKVDSPPKPYTYEADIIGLGYSGFTGDRKVTAFYGELTAPVLKNLELSAALRTDHYSDYGDSTTPKVGFKYTPLPQLLVRGTYAEGFRAPGAAESGKSVGGSAGYTNVRDPIRCPGGVLAPGLPATDAACNQQVLAISTANPFVEPEKSKSYTFGLVIEPTKDTSVSVDYWKITRKNEILGADPATVLANPGGFPAATITRNPDSTDGVPGVANSGSLVSIGAPYTNGPSTKTDGIDLDVRQRFNLGEAGKLTGSLTWTHIMHFKRTLTDGNTYEYSGTDGPTSLSSSSGQPKDKATFQLTWDRGPLSLTGTLNYVSGYKNVEYKDDPNGCLIYYSDGSEAPGPGCKTPSFTTFDLTGKYQVTKALQVYGGITNVFDRIAPYDLSAFYGITHYNANYNQAGGIGRTYNVGLKYQFN